MVRQMVFKMERPGLLKEGDEITVTEGELPSNVYYTIDPSLAMSANFPFRERMSERKGTVLKVEENDRGFYVTAEFDSEKQ
ncbi:hypothetical protein [Butyrivibrio sp. AE3004]|uniref:hypothetical protein n=1 Tax=Butyrivibrio sp. AE3004 TaxID=1506994 RepID=UPI000493B706|nr:hypothetical protein [Butyrivibrio sp. AE3004]